MHHAVVIVGPHPHAAAGPQPPVLGLPAVGLAVRGPAAGLPGELLGPHRFCLGQQLVVGLNNVSAGLVDGLCQPLGVGLRHPPRLHRLAHRGNGPERLGRFDLAAGLMARHPGCVRQDLGAAVAVALGLRDDAGRARLERRTSGHERLAHRKRLTHLRTRRRPVIDVRQHLLGGGLSPSGAIDQHADSISHRCENYQALSCIYSKHDVIQSARTEGPTGSGAFFRRGPSTGGACRTR